MYVDDIILSAATIDPLLDYRDSLVEAAAKSGFQFNSDKTSVPSGVAEAFNIEVAKGGMRIADRRMTAFENEMHLGNANRMNSIIAYVGTVNYKQANDLKARLLGP